MGGGSRDPTAPPHEKNAMIAVIIIIGKASPRKKQDKAASLLRILGSGPRRRRLSGRPAGLMAHLMAVLTLASTPLGRR